MRSKLGAALAALAVVATGCTWIVRVTDGAGPTVPYLSRAVQLSADGRFAAFESTAENLVPGDTDGVGDVFVRDNAGATTERVSVDSSGGQANGPSRAPRLSEDGRFVVFESDASNLVPDDTDGAPDVFVHDRQSGETRRVSDGSATRAAEPDISADGRYVVYTSGTTDVRYLQFATILRVDQSDGSVATVGGGFTGGIYNGGSEASISDDGRYVAFTTFRAAGGPTGFVVGALAVRDLGAGGAVSVLTEPGDQPAISGDGGSVAYRSDTSLAGGVAQVRVRTLATGVDRVASVGPGGAEGDAASSRPDISDDGRYVIFSSAATDLVGGATDGSVQAYVRDLVDGRTVLVSRTAGGTVSPGGLVDVDIADAGRYVGLVSTQPGLVPGEADLSWDVYVRAFPDPVVTSVSPSVVPAGATATLIITGQDLRAPLSAGIVGHGDVGFGPVTALSETSAQVVATVAPDAETGPRTLALTNLGTGPGPAAAAIATCTCLTVSSG